MTPLNLDIIYGCSLAIMNICIGKLSQSPNQNTVEFVRNEDRVSQLFTDKSLEINSCFAVTDDCNQISYQKKDSYLRSNRRSQMCINASTTAFARIYLDQALRRLQDAGIEPLYCDTGVFSEKGTKNMSQYLFFKI